METAPESMIPVLTKQGYYCKPSIDVMRGMTESELARIEEFEVGRHGFGKITWPGLTDVRNLNLDELVNIAKRNFTVSPSSLKKAMTLHMIIDHENKIDDEKMLNNLKNLNRGKDHKFISWDGKTWVFHVPDPE